MFLIISQAGKSPLPHVRYLTLSGRKISTIAPRSFSLLPNLKHLNLSNNLLTNIER